MHIALSSGNPTKALQIQDFFRGTRYVVRTLRDLGVVGEAVEDGTTLQENAEKKARFAHERVPHLWCMADDTGIFINALGGEPGIYAARWLREGASAHETMQYCLERLSGADDRSAIFRTAAVLISPTGESHTFIGEVHGTLLTEPRCEPQPKMPYSPLFVPDGESLAWAQMATEYENRISHRGKAFAQVRTFLIAHT